MSTSEHERSEAEIIERIVGVGGTAFLYSRDPTWDLSAQKVGRPYNIPREPLQVRNVTFGRWEGPKREIVVRRLEPLMELSRLESVTFVRCTFKPDAVELLVRLRLKGTQELSFAKCVASQALVDHVARVESLKHLDLDGTDLSGVDTDVLSLATGLEWLSLARTNVTDEKVAFIQSLSSLTDLDLSETNVTDEGLKCCTGLHKLYSINLWDCRIEGPGLQYLSSMENGELHNINIRSTEVTDEGLTYLRGGEGSILQIDAEGTPITAKGEQYIHERFPLSEIDSDGRPSDDV